MTVDVYLAIGQVGEPVALLREVQTRMPERIQCVYLYPQLTANGPDDFARSHAPLVSGPLRIPEPFVAKSLSQVAGSTVVIDLDGIQLTPRYEHAATGSDFLVPEIVRRSWSEEQRRWLDSECKRHPAVGLDTAKELARELMEQLLAKHNKVIICDAIERPGEILPDGFDTADELQMALMELNLYARTLSAEFGVLIMHAQIGVRSAFGGAMALQTDHRRGGEQCAELLALELERTLEQSYEEDWFEQERALVEEKMNG